MKKIEHEQGSHIFRRPVCVESSILFIVHCNRVEAVREYGNFGAKEPLLVTIFGTIFKVVQQDYISGYLVEPSFTSVAVVDIIRNQHTTSGVCKTRRVDNGRG